MANAALKEARGIRFALSQRLIPPNVGRERLACLLGEPIATDGDSAVDVVVEEGPPPRRLQRVNVTLLELPSGPRLKPRFHRAFAPARR